MPSATAEPPAPPDPPRDVPCLRLSSPTDLLAAVPYLLGFHPSDSLVLVGIRDRQVAVVLRVDLPPAPATGPPPDPGELIGYLVDVLGRQGPVRLVLVGYGPAGRVDPFVTEVRAAFAACDLPVLDALRVADGRYWSLTRREPSGAGEGVPFAVGTSPVAADATLAGLVALPDREALARRVAPVDGERRVAMERATHRAEVRWGTLLSGTTDLAEVHERILAEGLTAVRGAVARYQPPATPGPPEPTDQPTDEPTDELSDEEVAWLGLVLGVTRVRDEAWGLAETGDRHAHRALWTEVVRRAESRYLAAPAALLAFVAWRDGDGPFATVALDLALAADADYSMAHLIGHALATGMPPNWWRPASPAELARFDAPRPTAPPPRRRVRLRRAHKKKR
jgi:hypothetical protein